MSIEASLLIFYAIFLIAYTIFSWAGIYHLNRFGYTGDYSRPVIVLYIMISLGVVSATLLIFFANLIRG